MPPKSKKSPQKQAPAAAAPKAAAAPAPAKAAPAAAAPAPKAAAPTPAPVAKAAPAAAPKAAVVAAPKEATPAPVSPPAWSAPLVRETFIKFFQDKHQHAFVPSSKTIPHDDPTLLFANAGMNQFKPVFLGTVDPSAPMAKLTRAANSQKCIRAGGKHNDLDDVGKDTYHHTFFEMLGNWSFGNYFKKEAIEWAWDLLTNIFKLDKQRLYVTYFGGDTKQGLAADLEARDLWIKIGVPADRVIPYGAKENFWEMGDQGPCGPCSEIHYDLIGGRFVPALVNADDPTLIEIWNLVFMQFNREADGSLRPLPAKHVDTGMGFERLVCALQAKMSNYDTDVFTPIFSRIQEVAKVRPYEGKLGAADVDGIDMAYRVVADHIRTLTVAISDGGMPSNEGRGYVLRRILRRGVRYARNAFKVPVGTFFSSLVDTVAEHMGAFFPELREHVETVKSVLDEEEAAFAKTLDRGLKLFDGILAKAGNAKTISGADAWRLYDTFGFPVDLTRLMAEEKGMTVDEAAFEAEQAKAKEQSKKRKDQAGDKAIKMDVHAIKEAETLGFPPTDDSYKYTAATLEANIAAIFHPHQEKKGASSHWVKSVSEGETVGILLNRTNFYAESGGQEYDTGSLVVDGEAEFVVENVQVYGGYVLHVGTLKYGTLTVDQEVVAAYDELRRWPLRNNHTATHVLNYALRKVLGDGIDQKGSLVSAGKLRFDFSYRSAVTADQLRAIEKECSAVIAKALTVFAKDIPLAQAKSIHSLRAVFGEVYPDPVRVVSIGVAVEELLKNPNNAAWMDLSIELCGGTHAPTTKELAAFVVMEESAIAKGVRRIVAVTGHEAAEAAKEGKAVLAEIAQLKSLSGHALGEAVKNATKDLEARTMSALDKAAARDLLASLKKQFDDWDKAQKAAKAAAATDEVKAYFADENAKPFLVRSLDVGGNGKALTSAINAVKSLPGKAALLMAVDGDKVMYHVYVDKTLHGKITALQWADIVAQKVGGKKGGRDESAQGAGTNVNAVDEAVKLATEFAAMKLQ
ncbi:alanine-tRNA ligase [Allomyces macrogynus ATCC 38327]|uniref:Alanine--tRNA ligase n=1 Tax=Allomyces macrogynus (strain ATCC 38327) TaxID=578462 RepID=A0A0L0RW44_ALLM3|nr:alanine-tRNA ligase [Allomyces macrogynus ATCC 38327]|eukprot:KNE54528.1 alanine-tRNA ligase [Allomyces macrogynus ATCC 38327]